MKKLGLFLATMVAATIILPIGLINAALNEINENQEED